MIIKDAGNSGWGKKITTPKDKKKRTAFKWLLLLFFLIVLYITCHLASSSLKTKGYMGLWDFVTTASANYWSSRDAHPENVSIEIKEHDLKILEQNREHALERGLIINDMDGEYVSAFLTYNGKKIKVKLRLKGHMTDHLQDNKWSFRIKIKDKDSFMGMRRFSFQHPGTRGYIYEWIYHELMKREDIIALRYKFINVTLNGKDWGVYAVEENFDEELIENNKRMDGPIIRFNPDMHWVARYNEIKGPKPTAEFASYYSANPEAYREDKILENDKQRLNYLCAIELVDGFRSRKLKADQVFDIPRLARFHAIIDLVGGQQSIDWGDIKYYYNPVSKRLEPVAYESFTQFPLLELSGMYKFQQIDSTQNYYDWHIAIFSDPVFFKEYISALERITEPAYLDAFFAETEKELKENLAILGKEFPYKKFDKNAYYQNQQMILNMLNAPKSFHAYFDKNYNGNIYLQIGSIESLPIEIKSIQVGITVLKPEAPIILPSKQPNSYVNYKKYQFKVPGNLYWRKDSSKYDLKVNYSVLGSVLEKQEQVFAYPHVEVEDDILRDEKTKLSDFPFFKVDEVHKMIWIETGTHTIQSTIFIPAGYRIFANSGVTLELKNNGMIISRSPAFFEGTADDPVVIKSTDGAGDETTGAGMEFINAPGSVLKYVVFKNLPGIRSLPDKINGVLMFYESPATLMCCNFYNNEGKNAVAFVRSDFSVKECLFGGTGENAMTVMFSKGMIVNTAFENYTGNAIEAIRSTITLNKITSNHVRGKTLNMKDGSQLKGSDVRVKNSNIAISAEDLSTVELKDVLMDSLAIGIISKNRKEAGSASVIISGLTSRNVKRAYLKEKQSTIMVNGTTIPEESSKTRDQ